MKKKATKMDWIMHKSTKPIHLSNMSEKRLNIPKGSKYIKIDKKSLIVRDNNSFYFIFN